MLGRTATILFSGLKITASHLSFWLWERDWFFWYCAPVKYWAHAFNKRNPYISEDLEIHWGLVDDFIWNSLELVEDFYPEILRAYFVHPVEYSRILQDYNILIVEFSVSNILFLVLEKNVLNGGGGLQTMCVNGTDRSPWLAYNKTLFWAPAYKTEPRVQYWLQKHFILIYGILNR
jgi:hypothetical protein